MDAWCHFKQIKVENMNEKAKFAVKILQEYDRQTGVGVRNTSDLSPLEEWLIIELWRVKNLTI